MALQRWRAITAPRDKDTTTAKQGSEVLARWLATTEQARHDETYHQYWQIYNSAAFADLWYEARAAGERVRARAVAHLYAHRAKPGGAHPDPRAAAAFSERAILTTAAHLEGITVRTYRLTAEDEEQQQQGQQRLPLAWLATYPPARAYHSPNTPPALAPSTKPTLHAGARLLRDGLSAGLRHEGAAHPGSQRAAWRDHVAR